MDTRRGSLAVPKVRQVGFFTSDPPPPIRSQSGPPDSTPQPSESPAGDSPSPVLIPPARHLSDNLVVPRAAVPVPVPNPGSFRRHAHEDLALHVGSYNPTDSLLGTSPPSSSGGGGVEFSEDSASLFGLRRSDSAKFASLPSGGIDLTPAMKAAPENSASKSTGSPVLEMKKNIEASEQNGKPSVGSRKEPLNSSSKPLKEKTTKAERRALQEAQRAAKAAAKDGLSGRPAPGKSVKQPTQKKDVHLVPTSSSVSDKKPIDRLPEKERKKDVPPTRMQFDDKSRVEKAKKRSVVNQTESKNRVELFRHLPQYEHGTQLPDLVSKFFQLDSMHPAVYKVGLQHLAGDISGGNARCIAMLKAFQEAIKDYSTPAEKTLTRDLTTKIGSYVSFLIDCRPLSMSMGNAIRFLKNCIANIPLNLSESEAKASLCSDIDRFITEKIVVSDKVIIGHALKKIRDGDVVLTYGFSSVIEMLLLYAHEIGIKFRVVVVDSRPRLEGQKLLRRLVVKGLSCTYTHINAVSYIMHEVTRVFLGASSILSNGTVYSRAGTASVAMVAHSFRVPVIICCEAYKFHERVQLDSICFNELGDPDAISNVHGRPDVNFLEEITNLENLQLLNLLYDATPSEYISMIVTDYGMIPPTSVPVIVREYKREHLLF